MESPLSVVTPRSTVDVVKRDFFKDVASQLMPQRSETVDPEQIWQILAQIEEKKAQKHPPLMRCASDLTNVRQTEQKVWYTSLKKKAFSLSFKSALQLESTPESAFQIPTRDIEIKGHKMIGEGCRSRVFSGTWKGKKVAVKQLRSFYDPENAEKQADLLRDLETLSHDLRHPSIAAFLGVNLCSEERTVNLVFEFLGGGNLEEYYDSRCCSGQMHLVRRPQVLSWCQQLFEGLIFLHDRKSPIIHRDLKPCNLILSSDLKSIKMRDFGVSKCADLGISIFAKKGVAEAREITTDLSKLAGPSRKGFTGTKRYMAPECSAGEDYTVKADIFSASLVMWFMAEGERPWERHHGHTAHEIAKQGRRPPLRIDNSRYPEKMAELIGRCWATNPEDRPSANEVLVELEDIASAEVMSQKGGVMCGGGSKKNSSKKSP
eukprot:2079044-Rhodomonas_salina.2